VVAVEHQRLQNHLLAIALAKPSLRELIADLPNDIFSEGPTRQIAEFLRDNPDFKGEDKLSAKLRPIGDYVKIIMLQFEEIYNNLSADELREQAEQLKHRLIDRYVKIEKEKLAQQMKSASDEEIGALVKKADELNKLIRLTR